MISKSRYTNDEMDDRILEILEQRESVFGRSRADIRLNVVFSVRAAKRKTPEGHNYDYECRQVDRRIAWLYRFGFIEPDAWLRGWRIVDHPGLRQNREHLVDNE